MKLLTKEIEARIPGLYETEDISLEEKVLQVKFFTPWSRWTWYGVEYDPSEGLFFGYVEGLEDEWGYFSLAELQQIRGLFGLTVERDLHFKPCTLKELQETKRKEEFIPRPCLDASPHNEN